MGFTVGVLSSGDSSGKISGFSSESESLGCPGSECSAVGSQDKSTNEDSFVGTEVVEVGLGCLYTFGVCCGLEVL